MAATIRWYHSFAATTASWVKIHATETPADTLLRFQTANTNGDPASNPIPIGTATHYSAEKWCKINVDVAPSSYVENLTLRSNKAGGVVDTGVTLYYGFEATYATPSTNTTTQSTKADTGVVTSPTEIPWSTPTKAGTGTWGNFVVFQLAVATTAGPGAVPSWTIYARYDEV